MSLELIDSWVSDGDVTGVSAAVVDASGIRETRAAGDAGVGSLFALASLTKPIVAAAVLVAAEEGALDLDDPVAAHVPEYGDADRRQITVRHLLAHASGLPESVKGTPVLEVLPERPPATRRVYSNEGYLILGLVLDAATGIRHARYVTEAVLEPLGMDAFLPLPEREYPRALDVAEPGLVAPGVQLFNGPEWRRRGTAAGGAFATAEAYGRFASLLLAGGAPLLHADTCGEMSAVQWPGLEGGLDSYPKLHCPDWGLGLNVRGTGGPHWCGDAVSPATLSHFGASGTLFWADPHAGVGLVCLANRSTYSGWMLRPGRWLELTEAVLAA
ncbi:MAG TPA: serine hydrolase domain-containing protein [Gaiellales bacterium]|nr:serine hydrolase domain-containing protein [Gaiellales bacterium]